MPPPPSSRLLRALHVILLAARFTSLAILVLWCTFAIFWSSLPGIFLRGSLAAAFAVLSPTIALRCRKRLTPELTSLAVALPVIVGWSLIAASNDRAWSPDQIVLPRADIWDEGVRLRGMRDFAYAPDGAFTARYADEKYRFADLETVYFVVEPYSAWHAVAHTFLTFGFRDGRHVAISVEIRKERGEHYDPVNGLFKQYEIMYVIGTERDLIGLRANIRKDEVYLYTIRASREKIRELFLDMLYRSNALAVRPEFYNTLTNACTTNLARHVNAVVPHQVPLSLKVLLPGYADNLAYDLGLIDTDEPFEVFRARCRINEAAEGAQDARDFSARIRKGRPR